MVFDAVVFDLFYTLVQPGEYPGGGDRTAWLARLLGISESAIEASWEQFEPDLESGRANATAPAGPELTWLASTYLRLAGRPITPDLLRQVESDWDLTRHQAILNPPQTTVDTLRALQADGLKIGVLSNTHALAVQSWAKSPLAGMVDATVFSHEIGVMKPADGAYGAILDRLGVPAERSAYVGDGGSDELAGARRAGFALLALAAEAPTRLAPDRLPRLKAQADVVVSDLAHLRPALAGP